MLPCRPLFAWLVVLLSLAVTPSSAADRGPNFIFVIADDHRWDAMGVVQREQGDQARYPWFETPSMDRLAARLRSELAARMKAVGFHP